MSNERIIFHVDVNSAFVSWEAVEMIKRGEQDIRLVPSVVGGDPSSRTSVVVAKSIPAKPYGINVGEPVSMAIRKCPGLIVVGHHFDIYRRNSKAFKDICRKYAPKIEEFSIDECFMDMTGTAGLYDDLVEFAYKLKAEIKDTLGFTVNIGIGNNKLCAKMASDFSKPDKVHTLFMNEIEKKMWPLDVGDLLWIGKKSAAALRSKGIMTIGDLANMEEKYVKMIIGDKGGAMAWRSAHGIDDSPVDDTPWDAKGYSNSTTLEESITSHEAAYPVLLELSESAAKRLRRDGKKSYCVGVSIRSDDFKNRSHQRKLYNATDITSEIYQEAKALFDELWDGETPLRLLAVSLSDVTTEDYKQLSLFDMLESNEPEYDKKRDMDRVMDQIQNKYGQDAIKRGL